MNKFENLAILAIELKRLGEEEVELDEKIKNIKDTAQLTKESYQEQKNLYIEAGYLKHRIINTLKELSISLSKSYEDKIKEYEDYLDSLLNSLIELDQQYKRARDIVKVSKLDKNCPEYSLLDIEFDY